MATLEAIQQAIDVWFESFIPYINSAQLIYHEQNGRYFQGLWIFTTTPQHNSLPLAGSTPNNVTTHPTDQMDSWIDILPQLATVKIPANMRITPYTSDVGNGFDITIEFAYHEEIYQRVFSFGPQSAIREKSWKRKQES